jgi:hypothetical protein
MRTIAFIMLLSSASLCAQDLPEAITDALDGREEELSSDYLNLLQACVESPIPLNTCQPSALLQFPFLSKKEVEAILSYREERGGFSDLHELQAIRDLDRADLPLLMSMLQLENDNNKQSRKPKKQLLALGMQRVLQSQKGYEEQGYAGRPLKYHLRYRGEERQLGWGMLMEKDAGELPWDYSSAHLHYKGEKGQLFLGDYHFNHGEGLLLRQSWSLGKSTEVLNVKQSRAGLKPHRSAAEAGFFRGLGIAWGHRQWETSFFASRQYLDAQVDSNGGFVSYYESGLHRTESELSKKDQWLEKVVGARLSFEWKELSLAFLSLTDFSHDDLKSDRSLSYHYPYKNAYFFGEWAFSEKELATTNGLLINLAPSFSTSFMWRRFPRLYSSRYANPFSESSNYSGEEGLYVGVDWRLNRQFSVKAYYDRFSYQWLRYQVDAPSRGEEVLLRCTYKEAKKWTAFLHYKEEQKEQNRAASKELFVRVKRELKAQLKHQLGDFQLKNACAWVAYDAEQGYLLTQDIAYKPKGGKLSLSVRYAIFDTEAYDARLYAYEPDVLYAFSVPAHYGSGQRYLLLMKYQLSYGLHLCLRFAETVYHDRELIKSGWEEIEGNKVSELKALLRYRF